MKIKTTAGESLRSEFTALECAAIKYAVINQLADGTSFVGVPDATEERYRNCKDVFKVDTTTGGGLFMPDEIDNAQAEALVTLNAALANGYYAFPGVGMVKKHPDFRCIAAGNTNGEGATDQYCGRYQMDESSRDRFVFVEIDYCKEIEEAICKGHEDVLEFVYDLREACKDSQVNLILGYRCLSRLCKYADTFTPEELINTMILKGKDIDSVRLLVSRFNPTNYNNRFSSTFKKLVK